MFGEFAEGSYNHGLDSTNTLCRVLIIVNRVKEIRKINGMCSLGARRPINANHIIAPRLYTFNYAKSLILYISSKEDMSVTGESCCYNVGYLEQ